MAADVIWSQVIEPLFCVTAELLNRHQVGAYRCLCVVAALPPAWFQKG
jgi:hypothetical protein